MAIKTETMRWCRVGAWTIQIWIADPTNDSKLCDTTITSVQQLAALPANNTKLLLATAIMNQLKPVSSVEIVGIGGGSYGVRAYQSNA
jgi:hypothetical protein